MLLKPHSLPRISRVPTSSLRNTHHFHRPIRTPLVLKAAMSTATSTKYDWMCIIPYQADAAERRLKCRQAHLDGFKPLVAANIFNFGGPYFDEPPAEGKEIEFQGSVMGCVGESREAVVAILKKDPYTTNEVWDWEKAQIFPFKCLTRTAMEK